MLTALLTGCTMVIKPAPETPLSAYIVSEAVAEADFPPGVFNVVAGGREAGEHLISHPGVNRVTFTGSSASGSRVAAVCGEYLKFATMELGGKSAALVLADADLDRHMPTLISSSLPNTGQVCFATTRVLIPEQRSSEIIERLVSDVAAMKVGNPHEHDTKFGPLVAARQCDRVEGYIASGQNEGATIVLGGDRPAHQPKGWYVEPTIFTDATSTMRIAREEIFGPVLCTPWACESPRSTRANSSTKRSRSAMGDGFTATGIEVPIASANAWREGPHHWSHRPSGRSHREGTGGGQRGLGYRPVH
jgi:aldehyde dehydrogenase (NAD+)